MYTSVHNDFPDYFFKISNDCKLVEIYEACLSDGLDVGTLLIQVPYFKFECENHFMKFRTRVGTVNFGCVFEGKGEWE